MEHLFRNVMLALTSVIATLIVTLLPSYLVISPQTLADSLAFILPLTYIGLFYAIESERAKPSPTTDLERLWDEYKILGQTVSRRENSLLVSGSIFVTASLVLLAQSTVISEKLALFQFAVLTSWTVYSTWLFLLQLTAGRITDRTYDRMRFMEGKLGIEVHEYLKTKRDPVRRWIWLWLLDGLLIAGTLMMGFDVWPFRVSLPIQVIFMASLPFWKARTKDEPTRKESESNSLTRSDVVKGMGAFELKKRQVLRKIANNYMICTSRRRNSQRGSSRYCVKSRFKFYI